MVPRGGGGGISAVAVAAARTCASPATAGWARASASSPRWFCGDARSSSVDVPAVVGSARRAAKLLPAIAICRSSVVSALWPSSWMASPISLTKSSESAGGWLDCSMPRARRAREPIRCGAQVGRTVGSGLGVGVGVRGRGGCTATQRANTSWTCRGASSGVKPPRSHAVRSQYWRGCSGARRSFSRGASAFSQEWLSKEGRECMSPDAAGRPHRASLPEQTS